MKLNNDFNAVLGGGGVGKSTYLKTLEEAVLSASTGIAAINLGGRTINSILGGYFNTKDLLLKVKDNNVVPSLLEISKTKSRIIIDEISMMPGEQLDLLCKSIEDHNNLIKESYRLAKKHKILSLIVSGDPAQLPPVVTPGNPAKPFFQAFYWDKFNINYLTEVKRQSDKEFIEVLNKIRVGKAKEVVDWFEERIGFSNDIDTDFIGSTFFPTNKEVDKFNKVKLDAINNEEFTYDSERRGKQLNEWKDIPDRVTVKIDMKVMLLCNNFEDGYANGDLGKVISLLDTGVLIKLLRDSRNVFVSYKRLDNIRYQYNPNTEKYFPKVIGSIEYLPIRQGDSSTIHKSQGLTLPYVQIDVRNSFLSRLSGGLYTALTRVTSSEGLRIVGSKDQFIKACYIAPKYLDYLSKLNNLDVAA